MVGATTPVSFKPWMMALIYEISLRNLVIHLVNRYLLSAYYVPVIVLGTNDRAVNRAGKIPALKEITF